MLARKTKHSIPFQHTVILLVSSTVKACLHSKKLKHTQLKLLISIMWLYKATG